MHWTALLYFPILPTIAARRLQGSRIAWLMPLLPSIATAVFLQVHGCSADDAWMTAATVLRYVLALALGGTLASVVGARIIDRAAGWRDMFGPACAAAAWSPIVFLLCLQVYGATGAGTEAAIYAAITVLLWGAAAGIGIVGGSEGGEPGRLLVAICLGLSGTLLGIWASYRMPPSAPVMHERAPFTAGAIRTGDFLLARRGKYVQSGSVVLLRKSDSPAPLFALAMPDGTRRVLGKPTKTPQTLSEWDISGRVFFRLGGWSDSGVVSPEQTPFLSQD